MLRKYKVGIITVVFFIFVALATLPGIFDWSNRIEPLVIGLPFVYFWNLLIAVFMCLTLIAWYFADSLHGDLDINLDELEEEEVS